MIENIVLGSYSYKLQFVATLHRYVASIQMMSTDELKHPVAGLTSGGYCFPYCFLETFVGGQGLDGGGQSRDGVPPLGKTLGRTTFVA